jgi:hypothetical protein
VGPEPLLSTAKIEMADQRLECCEPSEALRSLCLFSTELDLIHIVWSGGPRLQVLVRFTFSKRR